jgi:hypothetical protein
MSKVALFMIRRKERMVSKAFRAIAMAGLAALIGAGAGSPVALAGEAGAAPAPPPEYLVKAAFLYNFAKFTEWPATAFAGPRAPLRLCVLGADPFGPALESIAGKKVKDRTIVTSRFERADGVEGCHVLFVSASEGERLDGILRSLRDEPVLTVADVPGFARSGGIVNLKTVENKVRFEINLHAGQRAGLRFSSQLLKLAEIVEDTPRSVAK